MKRNVIRKNTGLNGISIERQIEIPDYDMTLQKLSTMIPYIEGRRVHKILDHNKKKDEDPANGHEYVEIGGIKWATMNVGATSETDYGLYFQWGDTQGYTADQVGSGEGQKYFGWDAIDMTKYNATDGKTVLEASDDAAVANWGGSWRMPTTAEFQALGNAVNTAWTADYQGSGVAGLVCTDKTDSSKTLFFPAAGCCQDGSVKDVGNYGYYWSSSLGTSSRKNAYELFFSGYGVNWDSNGGRSSGCAVRGVIDSK